MIKRIAWFTPIAGSEIFEGQAEYFSRILLPHLEKDFDLHIFSKAEGSFGNRNVDNYLNAAMEHRKEPFDIFIYNLEDSKESYFSRSHLGLIPGITIFHDYMLSSDGPEPILNSPFEESISCFHDSNRAFPARGFEFEREKPFAIRETALSFIRIFPSPLGISATRSAKVLNLNQDGDYYLPYPVADELFSRPVPDLNFKAAFVGTPRIESRAHIILEAFSRLRNWELLWMIDAEEESEAISLVQEFPEANVTLKIGRSPDRYADLIKETCVALHLRFSVFGSPLPYSLISLAAQQFVICSRFAWGETLPDTAAYKLSVGEGEQLELISLLEKIEKTRKLPDTLIGREYAREFSSPKAIASEFIDILRLNDARIEELYLKWGALSRRAKDTLLKEAFSNTDKNIKESFNEFISLTPGDFDV